MVAKSRNACAHCGHPHNVVSVECVQCGRPYQERMRLVALVSLTGIVVLAIAMFLGK